MKIFIEIPTWLGDAVMTTPAIENIIKYIPNAQLIVMGSVVSTKIFLYHPNTYRIITDDSKNQGFRYKNLFYLAKKIGKVDIAISFRRNFTTSFLLFFISTHKKFIYKRYTKKDEHLVVRYNDFINKVFNKNEQPMKLKIYGYEKKQKTKKILGINPGATYGSAKRWYPEKFADVIINLSKKYDTIIFGGKNEVQIAHDIENIIRDNGITNYRNLAGKTSIEELFEEINALDLFVTNDSGPMHLASAFQIPSVCIFGPTKYNETSQWENDKSIIIKKDYSCMPCMKRECFLKGSQHHQCMKNIEIDDVMKGIACL